MDLTFQVPCNIALYSIRVYFHHQSHPQLCVVFSLAPSLHFSGFISPLISSSILGTYRPGKFIFQCPIFLPFHTVHGVVKAKYSSGLPFSSPVDHILSDLSTMTQPLASLSFIELDKAVIHVIRLASCLSLYFQSVCPLIPSLSAYHLTWVSLTLDVWYLS